MLITMWAMTLASGAGSNLVTPQLFAKSMAGSSRGVMKLSSARRRQLCGFVVL